MSPPPSIPRGDDRWRARTSMPRAACRTPPEGVPARLRMPRNTSPTADATPAVAFEVERFGWTASDRIEVTGRWFGLRGHRFMRPALIVEAGDDRRRLLALLDHKPWAADDGEPWIAAFAWAGEPVALTFAELSVAPSVSVELPPPPAPGSRATGARRRAQPPRAGAVVTARGASHADTPARELEQARAETAALRSELAEARARLEALKAAPPPAEPADESLAAERDGLADELRKARTRADDLRRERDEARAAATASP